MRKYLVLVIITLFLGIVLGYLLTALNPFDQDKLGMLLEMEEIRVVEEFEQVVDELNSKGLLVEFLNSRNLILIGSLTFLFTTSMGTLLHLVFDKLFIKKWRRSPEMAVAIRRGALLGLMVISILVLKLFAVELYLILMTVGLIALVELMVTWALAGMKMKKDQVKSKEVIPEEEKNKLISESVYIDQYSEKK